MLVLFRGCIYDYLEILHVLISGSMVRDQRTGKCVGEFRFRSRDPRPLFRPLFRVPRHRTYLRLSRLSSRVSCTNSGDHPSLPVQRDE